jgi:cathepsin L
MLQGRYEAQMGANRSFSAQELIDCVPNPKKCGGSGGCDGATVEQAMMYVQERGLRDASESPYAGKRGECMRAAAPVASRSFLAPRRPLREQAGNQIGLARWSKLPPNKALPLMHAVAEGPVAISVAAADWFIYRGGIFDGCDKDVVINHAVTLFGYGDDGGTKYWTIRNSWGPDWGENGFIRLLRHETHQADDSFCGIDSDPKSGNACKPYPKQVQVCGMCGLLFDSVAAHFDKSLPRVRA